MLIVREIKDTVVTNLRNAPHVKDVEKMSALIHSSI